MESRLNTSANHIGATADREASAVVPYIPSLELYRRWMRLRLSGVGDAEAWRDIVASTPRAERRHMARSLVAGAGGQPPIRLSVPVEGGGSTLKRGHTGEWRISMHGRWPAVHRGALAAAYSSAPYYIHLEDSLERIYDSAGEGESFAEFTWRLHRMMMQLIDIERLMPDIRRMHADDADRLRHLAEEKSIGLHADFSFLDVIFKKGPEAIFTLLT